jgi:hypothetical protein
VAVMFETAHLIENTPSLREGKDNSYGWSEAGNIAMTTPLDKTLKRELRIKGRLFVIAISPEELKLTLKGHRKGLQIQWEALVSGEAALAVALNASVGEFSSSEAPGKSSAAPAKKQKTQARASVTTAKVRKTRRS